MQMLRVKTKKTNVLIIVSTTCTSLQMTIIELKISMNQFGQVKMSLLHALDTFSHAWRNRYHRYPYVNWKPRKIFLTFWSNCLWTKFVTAANLFYKKQFFNMTYCMTFIAKYISPGNDTVTAVRRLEKHLCGLIHTSISFQHLPYCYLSWCLWHS